MKNIITSQSPLVGLQLGKILCGKLNMVRNEVERGEKMENCKHTPLPTSLFILDQGVQELPLLVFLDGD